MARLKDRVAIVTGAAQGIGQGIARAMTIEGALVILWDIKDSVHQTAREIGGASRKMLSAEVDVSDCGQVEEAVRQVIKEVGRIDILVNNAGIARFAPFVEMTNRVRDEVIQVNFYGMWNCTRAVIPSMIQQAYGRVVNVSSVTGPRVATPGLTAYAASKGAISGFTRTLALEVAEHGINVNAILPGFIDTPLTQPMAADFKMGQNEFSVWLSKSLPMKRMGTIEEVGDLAVFLASEASAYITGQEIVIDGGNIIQEVKGVA